MSLGIDRIGGAARSGSVGRVDDAAAAPRVSAQAGVFAHGNLTITESSRTKSAAELGFESEPSRNDELSPLLSRYAYPPPPMPVWG